MVSIGLVGSVTRKLVNNDANGLLRMLEDMGRDALLGLVGGSGTPIGMGLNAFLKYVDMTNKESLRQQKQKDKPLTAAQRRRNQVLHREWLQDNRWRFDWRSQPRRPAGTEAGGEWMEGRLDYMAEQKKAFSRAQMRRRTRSMREYKARQHALGNNKTRTIRSAWGDF
mgnify:CR=1 FL=1